MSRTYRKYNHKGHDRKNCGMRRKSLMVKSSAKRDGEPSVRNRIIPPDNEWIETFIGCESNRYYKIAKRLSEKGWGSKRIAQNI